MARAVCGVRFADDTARHTRAAVTVTIGLDRDIALWSAALFVSFNHPSRSGLLYRVRGVLLLLQVCCPTCRASLEMFLIAERLLSSGPARDVVPCCRFTAAHLVATTYRRPDALARAMSV